MVDVAAMIGLVGMLTRARGRGRASVAAAILMAASGLVVPGPAQAQFFWEQAGLSPDDAARVAIQHGFRVLVRPVRNQDVYVVQVVSRRGDREQLIVAAANGRILQRFAYDAERPEQAYRDPTIPPGPIPPGRVPLRERHPNNGFFARLFGNDDQDLGDSAEHSRPSDEDQPAYGAPEPPVRAPRPRRQSRAVETAPETIRQAPPIESAPLAPPSAAPSLPRTVATPRPAPARAPAEASLPASSAPASPPVTPAPVAPAPSDRSGRAISSNPLAIPGSREQDEKAAEVGRSPAKPATPPPVKPDEPAKPPVAVAPLE